MQHKFCLNIKHFNGNDHLPLPSLHISCLAFVCIFFFRRCQFLFILSVFFSSTSSLSIEVVQILIDCFFLCLAYMFKPFDSFYLFNNKHESQWHVMTLQYIIFSSSPSPYRWLCFDKHGSCFVLFSFLFMRHFWRKWKTRNWFVYFSRFDISIKSL